MGKLEKFVAFAKALPEEARLEIESMLDTMMLTYSTETGLSSEQEADLAKRWADPNPKFAPIEEIEAIFGREFRK